MGQENSSLMAFARNTLTFFPIQAESIFPLRKSDNITFRIEAKDRRTYLLRIHLSNLVEAEGCRQTREGILSELAWLTSLSDCGFEVQRPVLDCRGETVLEMELEGRPVLCTLMSWLNGTAYEPAVHGREGLIFRFGQVVAELHQHVAAWQKPTGFVRPVYDIEYFNRQFSNLELGRNLGIISTPDWEIIQRVFEGLRGDINAWGRLPDQWGLIHSDLHIGNILVRDEQILPIDFSLCGFGSFLFDLSIALTGGVPAYLRSVLLSGYRSKRELSKEYLPLIQAGGMIGFLMFCAFQISNPAVHDWFLQRIPGFTANECHKYLQGASIYFDENAI